MRKLNDGFLHDPFPASFTYEVLENMGGHEAYSFTDGLLGYHHIKIAPKACTRPFFPQNGDPTSTQACILG
jgi:hypothetical protein